MANTDVVCLLLAGRVARLEEKVVAIEQQAERDRLSLLSHLGRHLGPQIHRALKPEWPLQQQEIAFFCWPELFRILVKASGFKPYVPARRRPGVTQYYCAPLFHETGQPLAGMELSLIRRVSPSQMHGYEFPLCIYAPPCSFKLLFHPGKGIAFLTFTKLPFRMNDSGKVGVLARDYKIRFRLPRTARELHLKDLIPAWYRGKK